MRYGPWPQSGRLLRHLSFSSSFLRCPNPGGEGHVKDALAHRAERGLPWTWPRQDYIAPPEEEEKAPQQPAAACGCQGPATAMGARCHHAARKRTPAPRLARAWAACPSARAGPAPAVRQHRGLEALTLTHEPYGSTVQSLPRREERPQRDRGRPTPTLRGSPGRRGESPQEPAGAAMPLTFGSVSERQSPLR